jgi:hypothetical protein
MVSDERNITTNEISFALFTFCLKIICKRGIIIIPPPRPLKADTKPDAAHKKMLETILAKYCYRDQAF